MTPRVLLVNPAIYDFSAFDFWLKPYGLLRVAGRLRGLADLELFDHMDRLAPQMPGPTRSDEWGRGPYYRERLPTPECLRMVNRRFWRFGLPRREFQQFLAQRPPFDAALIAATMTYWYPGVKEVVDDLRRRSPETKIVIGGPYPSLCPAHAAALEADLLIRNSELAPLWQLLAVSPPDDAPAYWEAYPRLETGVLKLRDGCPCRCSYCAVPLMYPAVIPRALDVVRDEYERLCAQGARHIAFYDDALLSDGAHTLAAFLGQASRAPAVSLHTPNALHLFAINNDSARLMLEHGFKSFYLGYESNSGEWLRRTGGKAGPDLMQEAVETLRRAGAEPGQLTAYLILGHPLDEVQALEASMDDVHRAGIRIMLSEFSPLPGTPDGDMCAARIDPAEPLLHNKTVWPIVFLGARRVQELKDRCRLLNRALLFAAE